MLSKYFKQTMDHFKIKGTELSKEFGCGASYISDIRMNKVNPPSSRMWELVETLEKLAPGARRYFGNLVAGNDTEYFMEEVIDNVEPAKLVKLMSGVQLSKFMFALAAELGKIKTQQEQNKKSAKTEEDLMLIG